jgi:phage shock protein A
MASGALQDASLPIGRRDDIQAALDAATGPGTDIDRELAQLKGATALETRAVADSRNGPQT